MTESEFTTEVENYCLSLEHRRDVWFRLSDSDKKLLVAPTNANIAANIARHFYNLALKNVENKLGFDIGRRIRGHEAMFGKDEDYEKEVNAEYELLTKYINKAKIKD